MFKNRRNFFRHLLAVLVLAVSAPAMAQSEYTLVQPVQLTDAPGKIEVLEFFSYGCPHCADFHTPLTAWAAKQGADVQVKRIPVSFGRTAWANVARLFYALEATGDLARLDVKVFKAIHEQRINLFDEKNMAEWLAREGVDSKKFNDAYSSFSVQSKVKRADQLATGYRIPAVPSMAVDGKYLIEARAPAEMFAIIDKLIAKSRAERGKK